VLEILVCAGQCLIVRRRVSTLSNTGSAVMIIHIVALTAALVTIVAVVVT